jgi:hypothetical protein
MPRTRSSLAKKIMTNTLNIYFKAQGATVIVTHFPGPFLKQIALFFISKLKKEIKLPHDTKKFAEVRWAGVPSSLCCPTHY